MAKKPTQKLVDQESTQKPKQVKTKTVKTMTNPMPDKEDKYWCLEVGLYPGILFGSRAYKEEDFTTYVVYLPFIDIAFTIEN
jgi:hypothetical protein